MPLAEFKTPEITGNYLQQLDSSQLLDLLRHKTDGLMTASRLQLANTPEAITISEELKKIQDEVERRQKIEH